MIERQYFHYEELDEFKAGMWRIVRGDERMVNAKNAANLMRDPIIFKYYMGIAANQWGKSAAHNLTVENSNRLAWLGHAGCCIGVGSPEENTRIGWHMLNKQEQDAANTAAQEVLDEWLEKNTTIRQLELC